MEIFDILITTGKGMSFYNKKEVDRLHFGLFFKKKVRWETQSMRWEDITKVIRPF